MGTARQRPLVVCAALPEPLPVSCREVWRRLPRLDGEAVLLEWASFRRFVRALRDASATSRNAWPELLSQVCDEPLSDRPVARLVQARPARLRS